MNVASIQNWYIYLIFQIFFQLKKPQKRRNHKKTKKIEKKKKKTKNVKDEIDNQDIENTAKIVKSSMELMDFVKEKEKLLELISPVFYGLLTNKVKYLKDLN